MLERIKATITTDASGNATVYITPGLNSVPDGLLLALLYRPGDLDTGTDLTITGETTGIAILTITNAGTSNKDWQPRALSHAVADGTASSTATELIPIAKERIKVVVASGGNTKTGTIEAVLLIPSPY